MRISRREFFYLLGGAGVGAALGNVDRITEGSLISDSKVGIRAYQVSEYFKWLQENNSIRDLEIENYSIWGRKDAIVAVNQKEDIEMIIPYRPVVTSLRLVGLITEERESTVRLVAIDAELPDWKDGQKIPGPRFFSANLHQSEMLSDLPRMNSVTSQIEGYVDFDDITLWTNINSMRKRHEVLEGLRFGVMFGNILLTEASSGLEEAGYVYDDNVFKDISQALGAWSKNTLDYNMSKLSSVSNSITNNELARIVKVSIADNTSSEESERKFRYYMI